MSLALLGSPEIMIDVIVNDKAINPICTGKYRRAVQSLGPLAISPMKSFIKNCIAKRQTGANHLMLVASIGSISSGLNTYKGCLG